jgi:hypothetical protein
MDTAVGIAGIVIIGVIALVVLYYLVTGKIDLTDLLSGSDATSLSRFQFLVFTFIIGLSYLFVVLKGGGATQYSLPNAQNAWALLGISGGSYVLGKGIQMAAQSTGGQQPQANAQQAMVQQAQQAAEQAQTAAQQAHMSAQQAHTAAQ